MPLLLLQPHHATTRRHPSYRCLLMLVSNAIGEEVGRRRQQPVCSLSQFRPPPCPRSSGTCLSLRLCLGLISESLERQGGGGAILPLTACSWWPSTASAEKH
ncbi:hypothetical protein E2562_020536 [Oryza meyeriana var. granulata]|uniref:Uncharacterized protein n=1 Tax=Oryza meyeriana var. granulata TaxID=110450 RepID=A0A6G1EAV9_9ORYZ|nr:hypothetical protein E2562_020536 [Oryza meyeriana var. granulata]